MEGRPFIEVPLVTDRTTVVIFDASANSPKLLHPFPEESFKTYFLKNLGASLIALGILGLFYAGSPFLTAKAVALIKNSQKKPVAVNVRQAKQEIKQGEALQACKASPCNDFYLIIERLNLKSQVIPNVDSTKKEEYEKALKKGLVHAKNSSLPGQNKLVYIFGHSTTYPWLTENVNTLLFQLETLVDGDRIIILFNKKPYLYQVYQKAIVSPYETEIIKEKKAKDVLVLQTCYPTGTDWLRLLIFAKPVVDAST